MTDHDAILLPDRLADNLGLGNLLLIRSRLLERFRQRLFGELPNSRTNVERFDAFRPEGLITKERLDDCGLRVSCFSMPESLEVQGLPLTIPARKLAPVVPAPP